MTDLKSIDSWGKFIQGLKMKEFTCLKTGVSETFLRRLQQVTTRKSTSVCTFHVWEIMRASSSFLVILNYALCVIERSTFLRQITEPGEDRDMFYFPVSLV